jgi:hypothetical protein
MKAASSCRAEDVSVSECFFVNVRNASGRSVGGGRIIGNIAALAALTAKGLRGWTGVPKAGEEEGIAEDGGTAPRFRNMGAGVLSMMLLVSQSDIIELKSSNLV